MTFWEMSPVKVSQTVFLTLKGKAREALLEIDPECLNKDVDINFLCEKLDKLFKINSNQAAHKAYGDFEIYVSSKDVFIAN